MNLNVQKMTDLYRAVVAEGGTDKTQFNAAAHEVTRLIQPMIDAGDVVPDTFSWVKSVLGAIDKAEKSSTDEVLNGIARGEDDFGVDVPAHLDRVACLGGGNRKSYRFLTMADLDEMDEVRHRNVRQVNRAYHKEWKPKHNAWRAVLRRNLTIGAAVEAGDLPQMDAGLFGDAS